MASGLIRFVRDVLFDPNHRYTRSVLIPAIVVFETVFSILIVNRVACKSAAAADDDDDELS